MEKLFRKILTPKLSLSDQPLDVYHLSVWKKSSFHGIHVSMSATSPTTILDAVRRLMPAGTNPKREAKPSWEECPSWPPDAFAVAAYLLEQSGAYARIGLVGSSSRTESQKKSSFAAEARKYGRKWGEEGGWMIHGHPPDEIQELWSQLIKSGNELLGSALNESPGWHTIVSKVLSCADEAAWGVGFAPWKTKDRIGGVTGICPKVYIDLLQKNCESDSPRTDTITESINTEFVRVLPKALTPNVGCTVRSLSHHLALLPGGMHVGVNWLISSRKVYTDYSSSNAPTNLLLIPFPYVVHRDDFKVAVDPTEDSDGYFSIDQGWLASDGKVKILDRLTELVSQLICAAEKFVHPIHQIIFPEASLNFKLAKRLAMELASRHPHLETVISGTLDPSDSKTEEAYGFSNSEAVQFDLMGGHISTIVRQRKHHRWRLDSNQVEQYELQDVLNANHRWWERLDIYPREVAFVNRRDRVQTVLICEDLARFDPILPIINSVGPNLVIALLMDGPQLEKRWPGRYATVLADDPGSSVLTLTSLGMLERSNRVHKSQSREIALWKDATNRAQELKLEVGHHALALQLLPTAIEQATMDRRKDESSATFLKLSPRSVWQVQLADPPDWISRSK